MIFLIAPANTTLQKNCSNTKCLIKITEQCLSLIALISYFDVDQSLIQEWVLGNK